MPVPPLAEIYARSPIWAQHVMCSAEGLRLRMRRYPPRFGTLLEQAQQRQRWSAQQLSAFRLTRLRALLVHAGRNVPYWRDLFSDLRFVPERLQHVDELGALPLLTKDIVVREGPRMLAQQVPSGPEPGASVALQTSGTTGAGLVFRCSNEAVLAQWAVCWRYRAWHGIGPETWSAQLAGRVVVPLPQRDPPYHRVNLSGKQLLLSGYHLGPSTASQYLDEIGRREIPWIHGYPSMVVLLAQAAQTHGVELPHLQWVTLASENVTEAQRTQIFEGFNLAPREHYAQTEAVANASECPESRLHIDDDFSLVELLPEPTIRGSEPVHRIVGTSFDNWHQPMIRYDTGDLARIDTDEGCACGRPGRLLLDIDGRSEDYVVLAGGALVGRTDHIFKRLTSIREAQIRQHRPGAIEIHVVPRQSWSESSSTELITQAQRHLGTDTEVDIVLAEALPRTSAGKLRLVVRDAEQEGR